MTTYRAFCQHGGGTAGQRRRRQVEWNGAEGKPNYTMMEANTKEQSQIEGDHHNAKTVLSD